MKPLTPRQERFCHAFVHYANGAHAAREAGYRPKWAKCRASWLLKTDRIRTRVQDIQAELARNHGRDRDTLIGKLETVYRRAIEEHQFYSAARAVELQAKLAGLAAARTGKQQEAPGEAVRPGVSPENKNSGPGGSGDTPGPEARTGKQQEAPPAIEPAIEGERVAGAQPATGWPGRLPWPRLAAPADGVGKG